MPELYEFEAGFVHQELAMSNTLDEILRLYRDIGRLILP